ncbi:MBL fold metallo-hydrolase [Papillibacter cinnamivorans]|uniref:Glyoxylase, beta-lactamase superfamily II n=1 Tax=Papillibacter cinnamivorans DSM 12816 TaxID=1122930 RepID=A0A1W2CRJ9_9FIRM|nr:MBL fold metallo-hydrolase [Papillibacter cinnamivorans]SMC87596.1 Glyoxylase, beta-lactamase superfamily II [Papillibacter cinnamivorans DSM 12816]
MKITHVRGNTYYIEATQSIPFYRLDGSDIILLDSGYKTLDREGLVALFEENGFRVKGIVGSHIHIDHGGNHTFFQERDGTVIALPMVEAAIAVSPLTLKCCYYTWSTKQIVKSFDSLIVRPDIVFPQEDGLVTVCGVPFGIYDLPGHSPGHVGISTPDNVLYVADAVIGEALLETAKLPTAYCYTYYLKSMLRLCDLKFDAYLLAHQGTYEQIAPLVKMNEDNLEGKAQKVLELLTRPMGMDEIIKTTWEAFGMRSNRLFRAAIYERNLRSFVEYLLDRGDLVFTLDSGVRKYSRV